MTVAFSTSSPQISVAIISVARGLLWSGAEMAPQGASAALSKLLGSGLHATCLTLRDVSDFAVDLGPGSFTGVRVGVVFAKVLAYGQGTRVRGATAFDLIDAHRVAFVPSRRGEVFVRVPGEPPYKTDTPPLGASGYEYGLPGQFPDAGGFGTLLSSLPFLEAFEVLPAYFAEPSISVPKHPYAVRRG